jgi:hypothetical protein
MKQGLVHLILEDKVLIIMILPALHDYRKNQQRIV